MAEEKAPLPEWYFILSRWRDEASQEMIDDLLEDAGFQAVESQMYPIHYSYRTPEHDVWVPTLLHSFLFTFPLLESLGHDRGELERLYE